MEVVGKIHNLMKRLNFRYPYGARDPKVLRKSNFWTENLSEQMKAIIKNNSY